jgi:predicted SprT family Zn-dependent metalloprotease
MNKLYLEFAPALLAKRTEREKFEFPDCLRRVEFALSGRMERALGLCYPTKRLIKINSSYFASRLVFLPYTVFHELIHLFLYDLNHPWGHTAEFYALMECFPLEKYMKDPNVHIHEKQEERGKKVKANADSELQQKIDFEEYFARFHEQFKR